VKLFVCIISYHIIVKGNAWILERLMPKSINQDIYAGGSIYHVQTEYYKTAGKIVTNIFKDGVAVKKIERPVAPEVSDAQLDEEIEKFHFQVINKLRLAAKKRAQAKKAQESPPPQPKEPEPQEPPTFQLSPEEYKEVLNIISPFFGIASSMVLDEVLAKSGNGESFLKGLIAELPPQTPEMVILRLSQIVGVSPPSSQPLPPAQQEEVEEAPIPELTQSQIDRILEVLSDYFGFMASNVLNEAIEDWRMSGGDFRELIAIIAAHADNPQEEEEIKNRLMFL